MRIIIGGDLVSTQTNLNLFCEGDLDALVGIGIKKVLQAADCRIFNLETPLTDVLHPIPKCGPNLVAPLSAVNGIKAMNPTLISLANNHILDQGLEGLESTINVLDENDIEHVGVGDNLEKSSEPYIRRFGDVKIGVYACAEHEFSIAARSEPGANPFDPLESPDHISSLKEECDYLIVLYHGGKEYYQYPSPELQTICRKMVSKGADIVVCQHSHCIGCYEEFQDATIVYGQGNFLFDQQQNHPLSQTGLLVSCEISQGGKTVGYIPIIKKDNTVRLAENKQREEILSLFMQRSERILEEEFIQDNYCKFADSRIQYYLSVLNGDGFLARAINKLFGYRNKRYSKKRLLQIRNYIECEAHREIILAGLKNKGTHETH